MNWLAHVFLSENNAAFRVGNLLPDLMSQSQLAVLPVGFAPGIKQHLRIDAFSNTHPTVRCSIRRFPSPHRRFAPILVDVFYDHFLSRFWQEYASLPLREFIRDVYDNFDEVREQLPDPVNRVLQRMREEDWLGCYADRAGLTLTLERISRRFRRPVNLAGAMPDFDRTYLLLEQDFRGFFPALQAHTVYGWLS